MTKIHSPVSAAGEPPDVAALEEAFTRYQPELLGTVYFLVGNLEDARDVLQEAFIKCWKHRDELAAVENLKAWIFRIALNTGRDLRQSAWRRKRKSLPDDENMLQDQPSSPHDKLEQNEQELALRQAIQALRPEEQEVFLLRQNGQMTYEEIAVAINVPTGTVKTRMRLAVSRLRETLADW